MTVEAMLYFWVSFHTIEMVSVFTIDALKTVTIREDSLITNTNASPIQIIDYFKVIVAISTYWRPDVNISINWRSQFLRIRRTSVCL